MASAIEALKRLKEGNRRYLAGQFNDDAVSAERRQQLTEGQSPIAVIIGCSDSRVPVELIFNQGLGDLFVIRVAGNIIEPTLVGSAEFAVRSFNTKLVVVLGHSKCGAVAAVVKSALHVPTVSDSIEPSANVRAILTRIHSALRLEPSINHNDNHDTIMKIAVRKNVEASVQSMLDYSDFFQRMVEKHKILPIGAQYDIDTGEVEFFD